MGRCKDDVFFYLRSLLSSSYTGHSFLAASAELAERLPPSSKWFTKHTEGFRTMALPRSITREFRFLIEIINLY